MRLPNVNSVIAALSNWNRQLLVSIPSVWTFSVSRWSVSRSLDSNNFIDVNGNFDLICLTVKSLRLILRHPIQIWTLQRENEDEILTALVCIQNSHLIHLDFKLENGFYSQCAIIKVIDFRSSCFIYDHLSSYVQSRSYRAPEAILGCKYDRWIDIWSLGYIRRSCLLETLFFQNDTV
jgi:serine/threonine protein kinase